MDGNGAEITFTVTAPVGGNGKTDGFQGADLAVHCIKRMQIQLIIQAVDMIKFYLRETGLRRILDQVSIFMELNKAACRDGIVIIIKELKHAGKGFRIPRSLLKRRQLQVGLGFPAST